MTTIRTDRILVAQADVLGIPLASYEAYFDGPLVMIQNELANQFLELWSGGVSPPDVWSFLAQHSDAKPAQVVAILLQDQHYRWKTTQPYSVEEYLSKLPDLACNSVWKEQLVVGEFQARHSTDVAPSVEEFTQRFPDLGEAIGGQLSEIECGSVTSSAADRSATVSLDPIASNNLRCIGRYRPIRLLGEGAFGHVWLAHDDQLRRQVAVKIPKPERFQQPSDAELYLAEARIVASLDHRHIVPVHDVGRTEEGSIYIVSKYIEGYTLKDRISDLRSNFHETARLLALVAQALHHAHLKRLIHRDIKPANILIEESTGLPFVADFGLAIREEDYLGDNRMAGTPAYMSPEQARGEGHRLDGRSDIFSLGVVLYELLSGERPFRGSTANELLHQVVSVDPLPPREMNESIPAELERICLKAISKRASDRYATAEEMADELVHWQQGPLTEQGEQKIIPKGLRSFDADDADFYLDLLPGPRGRNGLPESIQFWKKRIEETDADKTFSLGLICGPSGCGKTSLVKAGLLPSLSNSVVAIYVEATPDETEARLLRGIRKNVAGLPQELGLVESFAWLRRSERRRVLIVLDQFEQWLHAHRSEQFADLVHALRQCDGGHLQALIMVRDDFAMAAARFMDSVDIPIVQGQNFATVDLFDLDHAERVLIKFGQAYGKLPAKSTSISAAEHTFVTSVANGLAQDGRVVSVRLAIFAEMVKGKPWLPETLDEIGGIDRVGVTYLDETFRGRNSNPKHRLHAQTSWEVLRALLPEVGTDIKGHMRSHNELLLASGYQAQSGEFQELLRVLDGELRLITPTDPDGSQSASGSDSYSKFYQLTHDYLVPSLRDWLTCQQRETRRGQAELKLEERAAVWQAKPESRHLPNLFEWAAIQTLTNRRKWTKTQQSMMKSARRVHALRSGIAIAAVALTILAALGIRQATQADKVVSILVAADTVNLSDVLQQVTGQPGARSRLQHRYRDSNSEPKEKLHVALALIRSDPKPGADISEFLYEELLKAEPAVLPIIRDSLKDYQNKFVDRLWEKIANTEADPRRRLRAAGALATFDPSNDKWIAVSTDVAQQIVSENAVYLEDWKEIFRPVSQELLPALKAIFRDSEQEDLPRSMATELLADYQEADSRELTKLLIDSEPFAFKELFQTLERNEKAAESNLQEVLTREFEGGSEIPLGDSKKEIERRREIEEWKYEFAKQQASAAIALLRLGDREQFFSVLRVDDDPETLTQFVHLCRARRVQPQAILECIEALEESRVLTKGVDRRREDRVLYGLLLALGEYPIDELALEDQKRIIEKLDVWFRNDASSIIHSVSGWLLRQWNEGTLVDRIERTAQTYTPEREWFRIVLERNTGQAFSYTFVLFSEGEYKIGSPDYEPDHDTDEEPATVKVSNRFAMLDREITVGELDAFDPSISRALGAELQAFGNVGGGANWFDAVKFCRWLTEQIGMSEDQQAYTNPGGLDVDRNEAVQNGPPNWSIRFDKPGFRLPTGVEWEVACRSGMGTMYSFGRRPEVLKHYGWFSDNSNYSTHFPRLLRPNFGGLFDMHGNLLEWCHDNYISPATNAAHPVDDTTSSSKVLRSGVWHYTAVALRSANVTGHLPSNRNKGIGFRIALAPESLPKGPAYDATSISK